MLGYKLFGNVHNYYKNWYKYKYSTTTRKTTRKMSNGASATPAVVALPVDDYDEEPITMSSKQSGATATVTKKRATRNYAPSANAANDQLFTDAAQCEDILAPILAELQEYPGDVVYPIEHPALGLGDSGFRLRIAGLKLQVERATRVGTGSTARMQWQTVIYLNSDIDRPKDDAPVYKPKVKGLYVAGAKNDVKK
mgnify:CR=1 FL=1